MSMIAPQYRAIIVSSSGEYIEMHQFLSLRFGYSLNRGSMAQITFSIDDEKLTQETTAVRQSWVRIERRDNPFDASSDFVLVWYGQLYNKKTSGDQNGGTVTMLYEDLASILKKRFTPKGYQVLTATDQGDILWDIINTTQSETYGDLGITRGAHPTSHSRTAGKDLQSRSILDILTSYSDVNYGIDWDISPTPYSQEIGIFNIYYNGDSYEYHKGSVLSTVLRYRSQEYGNYYNNNIVAFDVEEKGDDYANRVAVYGAAIDSTQRTGTSEDTTAQANYGLFETHVSESDVSSLTTLADKSSSYLRELKQIPKLINLQMRPLTEPRFGTFDVGDIFNVDIRVKEVVNLNAQYRLYEFSVSVDNVGKETIHLTLNVV